MNLETLVRAELDLHRGSTDIHKNLLDDLAQGINNELFSGKKQIDEVKHLLKMKREEIEQKKKEEDAAKQMENDQDFVDTFQKPKIIV